MMSHPPKMDKMELVGRIQSSHRQLERYIFIFEKGEAGGFIASGRAKFGKEEMLQPGVVGEWSLKDLLAHIIDWEQRCMDWCRAGPEESPAGLPAPDLDWAQQDPVEHDLPASLRAASIEATLIHFQKSYASLLEGIESAADTDLLTPGRYTWTEGHPLVDFVALATFRHYDWAKQQIRRWRKRHAGQTLNKVLVLERIQTERRRLETSLKGLSREQMETAGVVGDWSVKDVLAHLVEWEQMFVGWYQAGLHGEVPQVPAPGISWGELDRLNQQIYAKHRDRDLDKILEEFRASYDKALATIQEMSEAEMFTPCQYTWLGEGSLVGYILANSANHYRWAKDKIRDWARK
jgi:hypothetical protein